MGNRNSLVNPHKRFKVLRESDSFGRCADLQRVQFLAGLETHSFAGSDADFGAGTGIAADTGFASAHAEDAEPAQLDALASSECLFETLEDGIYCGLRLGSGETCALNHIVDDVLFNQKKVPP